MNPRFLFPCDTQSQSISVVIPVLNEAPSLARLMPNIAGVLAATGMQWEIVIVDDGSSDNLAEAVAKFEQEAGHVNLQLIRLSRNFGKEAALSAGLLAARGAAVLCMDGDGQHPHYLIPRMISLWLEGNDMVVGVQKERSTEGKWVKKIKAAFYRFLQGEDRFQIPANAGDFRLMDRRVVAALLKLPERTRYMKGLYAWIGFRSIALPFEAAPRTDGNSKFRLKQLFELALAGITSFSMKPLRLVSRIGVSISLLALIYGIYIAVEKLLVGNPVSGWATLASGVMMLSGIQLVCLGIIGEYLGRVFEETKQRPLYIVADKIDHSELTYVAQSRETVS